ncbi:unnamed protein product [Gongylonema pulchrum]|uniref:Uncharacterized protein n=1 Tax=Gongylonema pulchrum TaxID=637853 RepID=A0A183EAF8_9BILA|nr:unnamed protein product [Gongylonema pulchrum]
MGENEHGRDDAQGSCSDDDNGGGDDDGDGDDNVDGNIGFKEKCFECPVQTSLNFMTHVCAAVKARLSGVDENALDEKGTYCCFSWELKLRGFDWSELWTIVPPAALQEMMRAMASMQEAPIARN